MPENIRRARNVAIVLGFIEFACCIASIALYSRRRSRLIIALIIAMFVVCIWGVYSKIRLSYWGLLSHAVFTISVVGGFFIYTVIEIILEGDKNSQVAGLNEGTILLLLSIPLLLIFVMGIYSLILFLDVDEELEER
jgi:hypothetical protein